MPAISASKYLVQAGWQDVPHLSPDAVARMLADMEPHLRKARSQGVPSQGIGAIYPIDFDDIACDPFQVPEFWPRCYALDVGWNRTAALWGAHDRSVDIVYLYSESYRGQAEPSIHSVGIKARGDWIPGVIDPSANNRSPRDGERIMADYVAHGLKLTKAVNTVEAGLLACWDRLSTGRMKVFKTLQNFRAEYQLYRREEDKNGNAHIVKQFDHLMDAMRYLVMSGLARAICRPAPRGQAFAGGQPRDSVAGL